jgi:hypothetical protein
VLEGAGFFSQAASTTRAARERQVARM